MLEILRYNSIVGSSAPVLCKVSLSCSQFWATLGHDDSSCYSQSPHAISLLYMFIKMTHIPYPVQHTSTWEKSSYSKAFWSNVTKVQGTQNLSDSQDSLFGVLVLHTSPSQAKNQTKMLWHRYASLMSGLSYSPSGSLLKYFIFTQSKNHFL